MKIRLKLPIVLLAISCAALGCARHVSLRDVGSTTSEIGVRLTTRDAEDLSGVLLALTDDAVSLEVHYEIRGRVSLDGVGDSRRVVVDGVPVPGEIVGVDRHDGSRTARVRRTLPLDEVAGMTFHRSRTEASTAPVVSHLLGPAVGGLLALFL
jgi:hypothetical protein